HQTLAKHGLSVMLPDRRQRPAYVVLSLRSSCHTVCTLSDCQQSDMETSRRGARLHRANHAIGSTSCEVSSRAVDYSTSAFATARNTVSAALNVAAST